MKQKYVNRTMDKVYLLPKQDQDLIQKFRNECRSQDLSPIRTYKYTYQIITLRKMLKKEFSKATKADIKKIVGELNESDYQEWTKHDLKHTIRKFWQFLAGYEWNSREYPESVKWIKLNMKASKKKSISVITAEEIKKMIKVCNHPRDKALISLLFEAGPRASELLEIKISDITSLQDSCEVNIRKGKTGPRRFLVISSKPYIMTWINQHPYSDDKEAPLWVTSGGVRRVLSYDYLRKRLHNIGEKAGIKKPMNPHNFRHSSATENAKWMTESQMDVYYGWVPGSGMPSIYVHLSGRDVDSAILKKHNMLTEDEEKKNNVLEPKKCPVCCHLNESGNKRCSKCGHGLDLKVVMDDQKKLVESLTETKVFQAMVDGRAKKIVEEMLNRNTE